MQYWIDKVVDINATFKETNGAERTPLQCALTEKHLNIAQKLLESGVNVNKGRIDNGWTPLYFAAKNGYIDRVNLLLKYNANINQPNQDEWIPLHISAYEGQFEVAKLLIYSGARINSSTKEGKAALDIATEKGIIDLLKQKILAEKDVVLQSDNNVKHTHVSAHSVHELCDVCYDGRLEDVRKIVVTGAGINYNENYSCNTKSMLIKWTAQKGQLEIAKLLIDSGAKVNQKNEDDETPLYGAAKYGHLEITKLLIDFGADANQATTYGFTPLQIASEGGHLEVAKLLIKSHANVNKARTKTGITPLCIVAQEGHLQLAKLI